MEDARTRFVVLMPAFGSCPVRARSQAHVVRYYENRWGIPVVLGGDERQNGLFSRTRGVNRAAREALDLYPERDAFIIADNDLLPEESVFEHALNVVDKHAAVVPHQLTRLLGKYASDRLLRTGVRDVRAVGDVVRTGSRSYVLITRRSFDLVNGMDERFVGWGPEDKAFLESVKKQAGPVLDLAGVRVHLWHPIDPSRRDPAVVRRNRERYDAYARASRAEAARLAREYGRWFDERSHGA